MLQFTRIDADTYVNKEFGFKILRSFEESTSFFLKKGKTFVKGRNERQKKHFFTILAAAKFAEEMLETEGVKIPSSSPRFIGKGARNFEQETTKEVQETTEEVQGKKLTLTIGDLKAISKVVDTLLDSGRITHNYLTEAWDRNWFPVAGVTDPSAYTFSPLGAFRYAANYVMGYDWNALYVGKTTLAQIINEIHDSEFRSFIQEITKRMVPPSKS